MKSYKFIILSTVAILVSLPSVARAEGFTAHYLVPAEPYAAAAETLSPAEKLALRRYLNYEEREPCQHYRMPPQPFIEYGCDIGLPPPVPASIVETTRTTATSQTTELRPVIADYTVYFDFDRSNIRAAEQATIDRVVNEIQQYQPYEVTLEGHTDRAGSNKYNYTLSQKRAKAVSQALEKRGIPNRILEEQAKGEDDPAVPTPDGVKLQENRRVVVQFRK